jgi:opacity protein-like surface antigen
MRIRTRLAGAAVALVACALGAPAAQAADGVAPDINTADVAAPVAGSGDDGLTNETVRAEDTAASEQTCVDPVVAAHLSQFGDQRSYFVAPGGDFEGTTAGWQLTGGANVAGGNEPFGVLGGGASSLQLPAGSSATSPVFCVDLNYPTFRFLAVQQQLAADAGLQVDVIYPEIAKGNVHMAATYKPLRTWTLMKDVKLDPQRAGKQAGWRRVALRFRVPATKKGAVWNVDNILVDPRCRY